MVINGNSLWSPGIETKVQISLEGKELIRYKNDLLLAKRHFE